MIHRHYITAGLIVYLLLIAGCYSWRENQRVDTLHAERLETPLAGEFCTKLLGLKREACGIRLTVTDNGVTRCVFVVPPEHLSAVRHEVGGHCMGQDH